LPILALLGLAISWVELGMAFYDSTGHEEMILGNVRLLRADRQPCPVCGHPTGDCSGEKFEKPTQILLQGTVPSLADSEMFYVEEDVFEERKVSQFSTLRVLVARKGQSIPLSQARELGLF